MLENSADHSLTLKSHVCLQQHPWTVSVDGFTVACRKLRVLGVQVMKEAAKSLQREEATSGVGENAAGSLAAQAQVETHVYRMLCVMGVGIRTFPVLLEVGNQSVLISWEPFTIGPPL